MLKKVAILELNVTRDANKLIGTGVHLLTGLKGGMRYKRQANGDFEMQRIQLSGNHFHVSDTHFSTVVGFENISSDTRTF